MDDQELISQLPARSRLFLYAKGAKAMIPISAVFPLGMLAAWIYGLGHWFASAAFTKFEWGFVLFMVINVLLVGMGVAVAEGVQGGRVRYERVAVESATRKGADGNRKEPRL